MNTPTQSEIKLNLGCGGRPLPGYINVDMDGLPELRRRYPDREFPDDLIIRDYDIFNLPFPDNSVAEVRAESLLEHLSFVEEPKFFYQAKRVLEVGGILNFSVPDFEELFKMWLAAEDDWKDFYRADPEAIAANHWFGQYKLSLDHRWGYLTASLFGNQHGGGQFHKNIFSVAKIRAILKRIGLEELELSPFRWQGDRDPMLRVRAAKVG